MRRPAAVIGFVAGSLALASYATHLTFIEAVVECSDRRSTVGGIEYIPTTLPMEFSEPKVPNGEWNLQAADRDESGERPIVGTIQVDSGMNTYSNIVRSYEFRTKERNASGQIVTVTRTNTCWMTFQVYGWSRNDTFVMDGPCLVKVNDNVVYQPMLYNPKTNAPDEPDALFALPSGSFVNVKIKKQDGSGQFVPHRVGTMYAEELIEVPDGVLDEPVEFEEVLNLVFFDTGTYEIEAVWQEHGPPDGSQIVEVNRSVRLVHVGGMEEVDVYPTGTEPEPPPPPMIASAGGGGAGTGVLPKNKKKLPFNVGKSTQYPKVAFLVERLAGSGGHEAAHHHDANALASAPGDGTWEVMEGVSETSPVTHPTGQIEPSTKMVQDRGNGNLTVTYVACSFGGKERVSAFGVPADFTASTQKEMRDKLKQLGITCPLDVKQINVRVPHLRLLPTSDTHYIKVGGNDLHKGPEPYPDTDNNHFGVADLLDVIIVIATEYNSSDTEGTKLRINDMSLPNGGLFDICGEWDPSKTCVINGINNGPGHSDHSKGRAADIPTRVFKTKNDQPIRESAVYRAIKDTKNMIHFAVFNFEFKQHGENHYHVRLED